MGSRDLGMVDFEHVKFGRVIGMSARLNRTVSVEKVVAECEQRVMQKLGSVGTTKSEQSQFNQVAKKLALAALIVNCFSYKVCQHISQLVLFYILIHLVSSMTI